MGIMVRIGLVHRVGWGMAIVFCTTACTSTQPSEPIRTIQIEQTWQLQLGDEVNGYRIVSGLGDISIHLNGNTAYAPFNGEIQPTTGGCVLFSSPEVPAYLFRLCGLDQVNLGEIAEGSAIGSGEYLHFATLRRQPEGTWTIVEPAKNILQRILK